MKRFALAVLGIALFAIGVFPSDVREPSGHTLYLGVLGSPLAHFRTTEIHEVTATVTRHELSHEWAIEFMSLSFVSFVAGIVLICIAAKPKRAAETTAA
jgi:asparagine N-glycosylation enzyme membrane subunit Stt3